ncbi:MAG: hypothetical protein A2V52_07280 [Actinobacteria bacterium RBG_19FT_COMBO_54_7]|uniref:Uncharacterized protein n=1 Tax=Candidatus Solincola sediminis TaxID=1797199 RepID=A0A1F2WF95_9ACTN|nr:MAG: hypothetical protein A2Y75_09415 [Candidatus Solincola sediminis]OFW57791.1 MAG: hypothetical protein A2W01_05070 [Candidatus Solincola sediminis]OFW68794.1 MAG: hypothetical protein A2V52_07280 [Actinobacteria bacterium RBG_19FT_COMBO_54_7]
MKERIYIPGPVKVMYALYLSALAVSIYAGFNLLHPFLSGGRYPWQMGFAKNLGIIAVWTVILTAIIYLYYSMLGKPGNTRWNEPLKLFRLFLVLFSIWWFLLTFAAYYPLGWARWLASGLGGIANTYRYFEITLWAVLLINIIYVYARWAVSPRFPRLRAARSGEGVS